MVARNVRQMVKPKPPSPVTPVPDTGATWEPLLAGQAPVRSTAGPCWDAPYLHGRDGHQFSLMRDGTLTTAPAGADVTSWRYE